MARGFVQVNVDADHEVQRGQGPGQARPVGGGQHRVGSDGDQGAYLVGAGGFNLFGQTGDGQFTHHLRRTTDTCMVAAGGNATPAAALALGVAGKRGSLGKHQPAGDIQMTGEHIKHIHQPAGQGAKALGTGANAGIQRGTLGMRQLAGEAHNGACRHAAARRHGLGREGGHGLLHFSHTLHPIGHHTQAHPALGKQGVDHGGQQEHVGTRAYRVVSIGHGSSLGAPRVNHHQAATARLQGAGFALEVRHRPHTAIAGQRVGTKHNQQLAAGDVGQRHRHPVAKHQPARELFGHLVQAGGGKHVACTQSAHQLGEIAHQTVFVGDGVAHGHRHGMAAMRGL
ncbi:hypothetical protein GALL_530380 [mine drainage metagenome]|uniref:Uncharacterized protein n=1 Tax=mine drainage metagenome TaxID=410659 RepID=A0A1J5PJF3_9ZZZZ